jgi:diguanylate cyclase (GGDEF)-like protein
VLKANAWWVDSCDVTSRGTHDASWLCPTDADVRRALDMSPRVRRARDFGSAAIGLALVVAGPFIGWQVLVFFALSAANLQTLDWRIERARRPDRVIAGSLLWTALVIAGAAAATGGPTSPLLPWIAIPGALAAGRFRPQVVLVGAAMTVVIMAAATFGIDPEGTLHHPVLLLVSAALLANVVATVSAITSAEIEHRAEANIDSLTGLMNRNALQIRFMELAEQARRSDSPIALIVCDLDRFKAVNDTHGHERGDRVLRETANAMRSVLRTFELIYRYGGEEFVVILPGATLADGAQAAERIRLAVAAARPGALNVTLSAGVSAAIGSATELATLFGAADKALYRAKHEGRNRVATTRHTMVPPSQVDVRVAVAAA